jgi:hypothetical protein
MREAKRYLQNEGVDIMQHELPGLRTLAQYLAILTERAMR